MKRRARSNMAFKLWIALAVVFWLSVVSWSSGRVLQPNEWKLGVAEPVAMRLNFTVPKEGQDVSLLVKQQGVGEGRIRYRLVRIGPIGKIIQYGEVIILGDTPNNEMELITFRHVPKGRGYQVEIYNFGSCLCSGTVKLNNEF